MSIPDNPAITRAETFGYEPEFYWGGPGAEMIEDEEEDEDDDS